ncbi:MAG: GtrA family protein [Gemmatimonadetes bacterium]|nr:GtrA family protein [Gemmatimonadota bacterium]
MKSMMGFVTTNEGVARRLVDQPFLRFLLSGGLNTGLTYALYLVLLRVVSYRVSYTISYCAGIVLSYELNRIFVFRARRSISSATMIPVIYLLQYLLGLAVVTIWVGRFGLSSRLAPIVSIALTIPLTFLLTRWSFSRRAPS